MTPNEFLGERVRLESPCFNVKDRSIVEIPTDAVGVITDWDGDRFLIEFAVGMVVKPLRMNPLDLAFLTVPLDAVKRVT